MIMLKNASPSAVLTLQSIGMAVGDTNCLFSAVAIVVYTSFTHEISAPTVAPKRSIGFPLQVMERS
jgi:hypothetical protein